MTLTDDPRLHRQADEHPYPLVFATISGAHLYGFPSPDSDFDLRGVHLLPLPEVIGLHSGPDTVERSGLRDGMEMDLVTHDVLKFVRLMLRPNGYVLEQLLSPLVVRSSPAHEELKALSRRCLTKHHVHHYLGFADRQWRLFRKEDPPRVKPLLYLYRVLLTGIHLMRSGEVEANLEQLNVHYRLPYVPELIERKRTGTEKGKLNEADLVFHEAEFHRLRAELVTAGERTSLPSSPTAESALNDFVVRMRMTR